uniref:Spindle and centriole-associated protein 1 n=1 Tax=Malurus cyaneus samueli TaxID=2593467 RepID=A0A8C5TSJ3_9PASS
MFNLLFKLLNMLIFSASFLFKIRSIPRSGSWYFSVFYSHWENVLRRREIHKSKNKALAHLELQEKALNRKWKKQKQLDVDSLEKRKLEIVLKIKVLQQRYRQSPLCSSLCYLIPLGFPNVTMAPNCDLESSQGPIVQKGDLPSQLSILNETVMDSQVIYVLFHASLNATSVIKRTRSRLQNEDEEESVDSTDPVRKVLNPNSRKQKQISAKSLVLLKIIYPLSIVLNRNNKSSLEVLNHMIHEVECELEEYERCTGREVQKKERSGGLSGFTLSLVNALCRLMRYLKETEMQLHEKEVMRQQQEEMLNEHRELIDALTAEVLQVREENIAMQKKLQQYMTVTDEKLMCLTQALEGLPLVEPEREQSPKHFGIASKGPANSQGVYMNVKSYLFMFSPGPGASGDMRSGRSFPAHVFQPAVLLSPPQQKSITLGFLSEDHVSLSLLVLFFLFVVFTAISQSTEREPCKERSLPSSLRTQSRTEENCPISRRQPIPPADNDLESSHKKINLSCPSDTGKDSTVEEFLQNDDLLGQIAELTRQNALIKAQLSKFRGVSVDKSDCLHQQESIQNSDPSSHLMVSRSLEERIAELNRQSTEARDKLLQLIDQQKSAAADMVPPKLSPVPTPSLNYTGKYPATGETKTSKTIGCPIFNHILVFGLLRTLPITLSCLIILPVICHI